MSETTDAAVAATDLESLRLYTRYDEGEGPVIVLLHGINADAADWRPVIDTIGPGYRCIAFDLLGFGESPKPLDVDYTADEHALVIENTLNDLGIEEQFLLVGYSLGGDIAVRYASTYPDRLRRLFLLSAPFYLPTGDYMRKNFSGQMIQAMVMRAVWRFVARGESDQTMVYELASGRLEAFAKQFLRTNDVPTHWEIMSKNLINCISAATFVDDLPKLTMPTVFAMGIRDPIVRPDQTPALQRLKPDIEIRRIVGLTADHFMLIELPERVGREIVKDDVKRLNTPFRAGHGAPLAILVGPEGADAWRPAAEALSTRSDVALIELMGFGGSPAPLSARYDLGDHVAAVRSTMRALWSDGSPVRVTGNGLAATVALGVAAFAGERVADVVAFAPAVVAPGRSAKASVASEHATAEFVASEQIAAMAHDERARGIAGEALERRIIPLYRSLRAVALATDPAPLVARAKALVRLVLPTGDADAPREWARTLAATGRVQLSEPVGDADAALAHPALAVAEIDPAAASEAVDLAKVSRPVRAPSLNDFVRSVDLRFIVRGAGALALGLLLLSPLKFSGVLLARGLAIWIGWSAITTVIGAFGLRREGKTAWIPWALVGAIGVLLGVFLFLDQQRAIRLFGWFVFGWALWRAFADLLVASKVSATPSPRWTLWVKGLLCAAIVVAALISPQAGSQLTRLIVGWYLTGSGILLIAYGTESWRRASRRVRRMVEARASVPAGAPTG